MGEALETEITTDEELSEDPGIGKLGHRGEGGVGSAWVGSPVLDSGTLSLGASSLCSQPTWAAGWSERLFGGIVTPHSLQPSGGDGGGDISLGGGCNEEI